MGTRPPVPADVDELIVVAAHPDDETLGAAGLIRRVRRAGGRVRVVVATDGEGSHPDSPSHSPARLAKRRRSEARRAVDALADGIEVQFLGLPDGALSEHSEELAESITGILDSGRPPGDPARVVVVAPWSGDGHRDHRVTAEVVHGVCAGRGIPHLGYPIWLWHWGTPADLPWDRTRALTLRRDEVRAKRRAISEHTSQIAPLSSAPGDEVMLHPGMREHFERSTELFVDESAPEGADSMSEEWFEAFYRRHDDPWGFETRWYEKRKRSILMSALPTERIGDVLEIGCSTGLVTQELAARAESVIALDPVDAALQQATSRVGADSRVSFVRGQIPRDWPPGRFDTIVLSEVGYYLSAADLETAVRRIEGSLADSGTLVACHWRHPVAEYPLTGDDVHTALRASSRWRAIVRHEEPDFILEVFATAPALSVAEREGLV
ncbi:bifunctional PIG-L family deacetylase/class I SAM-dependent methyltransferase [Microbacterium sp. NPDC019599]|uniref:bifunctional PIG-L family deacetylase/class I SAM-dependent methyltransferase n=1 Tax=Microbacterium sp. NPDC019599 TaxID=3154690 RepID=UPI0033FB52A8